MTYRQAVITVWLYRILGCAVVLLGLLWLLVSVFIWAYFLPAHNAVETTMYQGVRSIISSLYQMSNPYIGFIWKSPLPFSGHFSDINTNKWLYLVYALVLMGVDRVAAAKQLASMIRKAKETLAQEHINASLAAHYGQVSVPQTSHHQSPSPIPSPGWFANFHTLYIAPLLVGVILFFMQKIFS